MNTELVVEYEVIEPVSNRVIITYNRFEALDRYTEGWIVYERHTTAAKPSQFVQTKQIVTITWNDNPEFEEEQDDSPFS